MKCEKNSSFFNTQWHHPCSQPHFVGKGFVVVMVGWTIGMNWLFNQILVGPN